ncbi:MAG: hypothetical protein AB2L11_09365 [Syntrophobacteraceae bacterium]
MKKWIVPLIFVTTLLLYFPGAVEAGRLKEMGLKKLPGHEDADISEQMTSKQSINFLKRMIDNLNREIAGVTANEQSNSSPSGSGETIDMKISESGRMTLIKYEAERSRNSEGESSVSTTDSNKILKGAKDIRSLYLTVINQDSLGIGKSENKEIVLKCLGGTECIEVIVPGTHKSKSTSLAFPLAGDTSEADMKKTVAAFRSLIGYYSGEGRARKK